ncbi:ribonuclease HII [Candidatus Woesearchaeota archaeon]|nr:ribonuclease HII [Candidatus Woesearchaeota archaeon]
MVIVCGIDEAGRGPVIGPMVMAGVIIDGKETQNLKGLGVKDSKLLSPKQREALYPRIIKFVKGYKITVISAKEIDDALFSDDLNLNWLEAHKAAEIINALKPDKAIIDSPSNNCEAYARYVRKLLDNKAIELLCMHKADVLHPEVSAASILAKVTRDEEITELQKKYGNIGPGYASNPITQKFIRENWERHPEIFRHSWETFKKEERMKNQKKLDGF